MNENRFARLFEVGGHGCQVLFFRERDEDRDVTVIHQISAAEGVRMDFQVEIKGEKQDETADRYLEKVDQESAERVFVKFLEMLEGRA
ncbi:MAG: hypothetical protein IH614_19210 [Desulfuromonadales bacterium]|nr:hypothetical protein [Desulfuromonadales bacterium]